MLLFKKIMQTLDRVIGRISYIGVYISGLMAVIMCFLAFYGVFRRYVLNRPEPYSYELSTIFLMVGIVLALPYIQRAGRHLRVDILPNRFPETVQVVLLNLLGPILALFYLVPMTWKSWENAWYSLQVGERSFSAWAPPYFPIKVWIPVGVGMLCLVLFSQLIRGIYSLTNRAKNKQ
jgi:TRAP-type mannitol/chloroaromatic compound transport system permease small subunit